MPLVFQYAPIIKLNSFEELSASSFLFKNVLGGHSIPVMKIVFFIFYLHIRVTCIDFNSYIKDVKLLEGSDNFNDTLAGGSVEKDKSSINDNAYC